MRSLLLLGVALTAAPPLLSATFGTASGPTGGAAYTDLVLDEARSKLYLVNSAGNRIDIYNSKTRAFISSVAVSNQPVAATLGWPAANGQSKYLYVTAYGTTALYQIDLDTTPNPTVKTRISLPYAPQGLAAGLDGRILVTTSGPGGGNTVNTLFLFNPNATSTAASLLPIALPVPPPTAAVAPAVPGRQFLAYRSAMAATSDGKYLIGSNGINGATRLIFVYEVASATILRSREVANLSNVLTVAPDNSRFISGSAMFDINTLQVIAQQNAANSPFAFPAAANFNLQQSQGGSVFSPDGSALYAAFNFNPVQNPAAKANTTILMLNDPANLLIQTGIQMPENLAGKLVITKAGDTVYGISDTGFITLPVSTIASSPLASVQSQTVFLATDQCGVTAKLAAASATVVNSGKGRLTISAQPYTPPVQAAGAVVIPAAAAAPTVQLTQNGNGGSVNFRFNPMATSRGLGTAGETDFLIRSPEAINIPASVRVFQNNRDADARGQIIPVATNISAAEGLVEMLPDYTRQRLYITNSGLNRIEVFDMKAQQFTGSIKTGQLPHAMAFGTGGNTLYVANTGGESIGIVDLTIGKIVDTVRFPPVSLNVTTAIITPQAMASSNRGPLVIMSDGSLWKIDGNLALPRSLNQVVFGANVTTIAGGAGAAAFRTMASSVDGQYILVFTGTGNGYVYDASADDFTVGKQIFSTLTGYVESASAGPRGQYYVVNGTLLNSSLTPIGNIPSSPTTGTAGGGLPGVATATGRPISAVASINATTYAVFSNPIRAAATTAATDAGSVQILDTATSATVRSANALEGPESVVAGNARVITPGRTLALDSTGDNAFALTSSGLSIIPLASVAASSRPVVAQNAVANLGDYQTALAPGSLAGVFGSNLASSATAPTGENLPLILGGTCVTLNNVAIPLLATANGQINVQIPPNLAVGRYPLVVRSVANHAASTGTVNVTVSKYAPAVFVDSTGQAAIYHQDGKPVTTDNPTTRDQRLILYATGLGATTGGTVTAGAPSPTNPLAVTATRLCLFRTADLFAIPNCRGMERSRSRIDRRISGRSVRPRYPYEGRCLARYHQNRWRQQSGKGLRCPARRY